MYKVWIDEEELAKLRMDNESMRSQLADAAQIMAENDLIHDTPEARTNWMYGFQKVNLLAR